MSDPKCGPLSAITFVVPSSFLRRVSNIVEVSLASDLNALHSTC